MVLVYEYRDIKLSSCDQADNPTENNYNGNNAEDDLLSPDLALLTFGRAFLFFCHLISCNNYTPGLLQVRFDFISQLG
jgi:hypothetical protein